MRTYSARWRCPLIEVRTAREILTAQTPASAEEFMLILRQFYNLLHILFISQFHIYKKYGIIKAFQGYYPNASAQLLHEVKTSILCIIILKSRRFVPEKKFSNDACLGEFTNMGNQIKTKNCGAIYHVEIPSEILWSPRTKQKAGA